jgi:plasmid stabilization system protein ParE
VTKEGLERHYNFWESINSDLAKKVVQEITKKGESLQDNPRRGTVIHQAQGLRKLSVPFGKYGFVIHYTILEEDVLILRVYGGRENRQT